MAVGNNFLEQLEKVRVNKKIITRSIRDLIGDFQSGKIVIPRYQRTFVWDSEKQNKFIESVFMDIPVPPLFFLEKFDEERDMTIFEIIDGVQRLTTIGHFINGTLKLSNLENLPDLNQSKFETLPSRISGIFCERQLSTIIIEKSTEGEIQFEVFGRLNMGSVSLNAQELRNCMFQGEFNDFLGTCSNHPTYRQLLEAFPKLKPPRDGRPDKNRMFDVELILRFFALYELYNAETNQYPSSRSDTLNDYMRQRKSNDPNISLSSENDLEKLLDKVVEMVKITFNNNQFKNFTVNTTKGKAGFSSQLNAAVFDVQMLGFADYELIDIQDKTELIYDSFLDLCSNNVDFIDSLKMGTNNQVNERMGIWKQRLNLVIENFSYYSQEFEQKKDLFKSNPICHASRQEIKILEEADYFEGKIYHKCYSPKRNRRDIRRETVNTSVNLYLSEEKLDFDNINDLIIFLIAYVADRISEDIHDINRLQSLQFIGESDLLLSQMTGIRRIKPFGNLKDSNGKSLYMAASGGRSEMIANLRQLISLFSFTKDFRISD